MTRTNHWITACALGSALLLGACASPYRYETYYEGAPARYYAPVAYDTGTVERIEVMRYNAPPVGVGAILGGVTGGIIGHQIGSGRGNTAATIAGAVGGALVGNEIEREQRVEGDRYRVTVRLDSGGILATDQSDRIALRVGDRVRVENGHVYLM
jgi:outer membrane lipoprotein SlyB